jgi:hypothetical protein
LFATFVCFCLFLFTFAFVCFCLFLKGLAAYDKEWGGGGVSKMVREFYFFCFAAFLWHIFSFFQFPRRGATLGEIDSLLKEVNKNECNQCACSASTGDPSGEKTAPMKAYPHSCCLPLLSAVFI